MLYLCSGANAADLRSSCQAESVGLLHKGSEKDHHTVEGAGSGMYVYTLCSLLLSFGKSTESFLESFLDLTS